MGEHSGAIPWLFAIWLIAVWPGAPTPGHRARAYWRALLDPADQMA